jgi:hypothetical protein
VRRGGDDDVIRIAISEAAYEAIAGTLLRGSAAIELEANARGEKLVWLNRTVVDRLAALRGPGESYSDVILRLAAEGGRRASVRAARSGSPEWMLAFLPRAFLQLRRQVARSGNRFERRMPKAESCARILALAFFGITN